MSRGGDDVLTSFSLVWVIRPLNALPGCVGDRKGIGND